MTSWHLLALFLFQIYEGDDCEDTDGSFDNFAPITEMRNVQNDTFIEFFEYVFVVNRPYKVKM